jgi:3D (Asp-Asp-Asp) domain-containing protein
MFPHSDYSLKYHMQALVTGLMALAMGFAQNSPHATEALSPILQSNADLSEVVQVNASPLPEHAKYQVWVTAYSSTVDQTDSTPLITASNTKVRDGVLAANFLPFGTRVQIPDLYGDKVFVVEDRMHRRFRDHVDIWMPVTSDAMKFGKVPATIVVLD